MPRQARRYPRLATLGWVGLVLALCVGTLLVFLGMQRLVSVPSPWPLDRHFAGLAGPGGAWEIEGDPAAVAVENGALVLRNDDPAATVGVRQVWRLRPGGPHAFRLGATLASRDVAGALDGSRVAEASLVADQDIGRGALRAIHQLAALSGTQGPARYVTRFEFPSDSREVELAFRLRRVTGELIVRGLELKAYRERRLFRAVRVVLQAAWVLTLAVGCWLFWRGIDHRRTAALLVAAAGAGLVLLMLPESLRDAIMAPLERLAPGDLVGVGALAYLGHFAIFAVAGFLLRLSRRQEPWPQQVLLLVGLAGLSELLQFLSELRSPTLDDWLTNAVGALAGWLPAMAWLARSQEGQFATQRRSSTTLPPQA
jgi:hypothetical protein